MFDEISNKRIEKLHPKIRKEVGALLQNAEYVIDDNLKIRVVQGLRTIEEQNSLYAQGRTKPGVIVTNAKGGSSFHNYGLAIDICFLWKQGDSSYKYDEQKSWLIGPNFMKIVKVFKDAGYKWGGDWKSIKDNPHFEKDIVGLGWRELHRRYKIGNTFEQDGIKYVNT